MQVGVDIARPELESGRHAVDERDEPRSVRLAGGQESHRLARRRPGALGLTGDDERRLYMRSIYAGLGSAARMAATGAATPVHSSNERAA